MSLILNGIVYPCLKCFVHYRVRVLPLFKMQTHVGQLTKQRLSDFFVKEDGHVAHIQLSGNVKLIRTDAKLSSDTYLQTAKLLTTMGSVRLQTAPTDEVGKS